jgi:dTMP kinase
MKKGFLISFEGGEGAGKTEQTKRLLSTLKQKGFSVQSIREPGGNPISEQIREVVLSTKNTGIQETTEVLLFQAARAQLYGEVVIPSLKKGEIVLMDRTRDSSVVYQGIVRGFGVKMINQLNTISTQNTLPDVTILLDIPVDVGLKRRADSGTQNRLDAESHSFHQKVRDAYLSLAHKNDHKRWVILDASKSIDVVERDIWNTVQQLMKSNGRKK